MSRKRVLLDYKGRVEVHLGSAIKRAFLAACKLKNVSAAEALRRLVELELKGDRK